VHGFPWWPSQVIYRSGCELIKAEIITKGQQQAPKSSVTVRFFHDDTFSVISEQDAKVSIKPFDSKKNQAKVLPKVVSLHLSETSLTI
jgi:hypothetical protein